MRSAGGWTVVLFALVAGCVAEVDILDDRSVADDGAAPIGEVQAAFGTKNETGFGDTFFANGSLDSSNPFFLSLGTNGRMCVSCHQQAEGWSITPAGVQ